MTESETRTLDPARALRQRLDALRLAGVEQLPRAAVRHVDLLEAAANGPVEGSVAETPQPNRLSDAPVSCEQPDDMRREVSHAPANPNPQPISAMQSPPILAASTKKKKLSALCAEVKTCELCPQLVENRTQTVFGVGNPQTRLCFFGEAPGADEDRLGEPFVGRAGQLLDKIIEACTLKRRDVYILNTVKCRPPGNRNPEPEEVENCRPFFEQQLEVIRPEFICCLGAVSARALLDTKLSIGKLRGQLHPWRWAKVLVTYHPAYLLRNPSAKREVWNDMQFLMGEMGIDVNAS